MGKKNTIEEIKKFIEEVSNCTLLDTEYKGYKEKLSIRCECGEVFQTLFGDFKCHGKRQCNTCGNRNTGTKQKFSFENVKTFIENNSECKLLSTNYDNIFSQLQLQCKCGEIFNESFAHFKYDNKRQCSICTNGKYNINYVKRFVKENSDSVLLSTEYKNENEKLKFQCSCGNIFERTFRDFKLNKRTQCQECTGNKLSLEQIKKITQEISNCTLISDSYINSQSELSFLCECGNIFSCSWDKFYNHNQRRCKTCTKQQSKGEYRIEQFFKINNIQYENQYIFKNCKNESYLRFDFAIKKDDKIFCLIEFDGSQHYSPAKHFGGDEKFKTQQINDKIKDKFCNENNIKLVRIPYWKINKIEEILKNILN